MNIRANALKLFMMLAIGLGGVLLSVMPSVIRMEESIGLSTLFRVRDLLDPPTPPGEVRIVEIDQESTQAFDVQPTDCLKWPRKLDGELVLKLKSYGVFLTVFDMVFQQETLPEDDDLLADAMRQSGNVVLAEQFRLIPLGVNSAVYENCVRIKSLEKLERQAVISAPSPVPELESRDTAVDFASFDPSCGPSLSAIVFYLHLLHRESAQVAAFLEQTHPALARQLSKLNPAELRGEAFSRLIEPLRSALTDEPEPEITTSSASPTIASLVALNQNNPRFIINHYGESGSLKTCSLQEILGKSDVSPRPHCRAEQLKDKIVFVGFGKSFEPERNREQFKTPFGKVSMVELIATTFANILNNDAIHPLVPQQQAWLLLIWGCAVGLVCGVWYFPRALLVLVVMSTGYVLCAYGVFVRSHLWLPMVVPLGFQTLLPAAIALANFLVPRSPRKLQALILASDMQDAVRLAESMPSEALLKFRQGYFRRVKALLQEHKGTFANQVADDLYGFWPQSGQSRDCARHACAAALEMNAAIEDYTRHQAIPTPLRIGMHLGEEESIPTLTIEQKEYRFIGKSSGIASRIENMNKALGTEPPILLSSSAMPPGDEFALRRLGHFLPQGVDEPIEIHQLIGRNQSLSGQTTALIHRFQAALLLWENHQTEAAAETFRQLQQDFPDDGPTRFYLRQFQDRPQPPGQSTAPPVIRIEKLPR